MSKKRIGQLIKNFFGDSKPDKGENETNRVALPLKDEEWLHDGYSWIPDWKAIIGSDWQKWEAAKAKAKGGPKVLVATAVGGNSILTPLETLYAVALTLRGAEVHFLLCDKILPACQNAYGTDLEAQTNFLKNGPAICDWCFDCGSKSMDPLGLPVHRMSNYLNADDFVQAEKLANEIDKDEIEKYKYKDIFLGESVLSGALRFFGRGDFDGEIHSEPVLRRFLKAAILSVDALNNLFEQNKFKKTIVNQGFYIPQGIEVEVATQRGSDLICWDICYRNSCITMTHSNTYYRTLVDESIEKWNQIGWNEDLESEVSEYLIGRWSGQYDWMKFHEAGAQDLPEDLMREIGIKPDLPVIGLLTNVVWDAQVYYPGNAFPNMLDWLMQTVKYFATRKDLQLLIRVHPAELKCWQKSRQFAEDEIRQVFPELPDNIFIVPPQSTVNTYKAMMACDAVLIYATTAGLELSCMGIPTIISGEAWMRGKGIGIDVTSQEHYFETLESLPLRKRLPKEKVSEAKKYAYHFYLRKMIPVGMLEPMPYENVQYRIPQKGLAPFEQGADPGLDIICGGILDGIDFVFPAELYTKKNLVKS